jgi:hypothetical protein
MIATSAGPIGSGSFRGGKPNMRVRWYVVPAIAVALGALTLSGCSDSGSVTEPETKQTASQKSDGGDGKTAEPADDDSDAKAETTASFEKAVTYKDGLKVEVSGIKHGKIGQYDVGGKPGGDQTTFTVRITNGSKAAFDATLAIPSVTYGEAGTAAEVVINDTAGAGFTGKILPGKSMSAPWAFAIPASELGDVTMQVAVADLDKEAAIFTGSAK